MLKNKKILIFSDYCWQGSGCWQVLKNYISILNAKKDEYNLDIQICFLVKEPYKPNEEHWLSENRTHYILSPLESEFYTRVWNENSGFWIDKCIDAMNSGVLKLLNEYNPHIIIDFNGNIARFDYFLRKFDINPKVPIIKFIHGAIWVKIFEQSREVYKYTLAKEHIIACLNQDMKNLYMDWSGTNGIEHKEISVLYNPINTAVIRKLSQESLEPALEHLLNEEFILAVGRNDPIKNYSEMLDIYAQLKEKGIREKLYILGVENAEHDIKRKIRELNLENNVLLLGFKPNPYRFMAKAKLLIHTAVDEGFGMVIAEAMACGTPVVVMDCPTGPREILDDGKYGILIPLHNRQLFVEKTYGLLTNENLYNEFVKLSLERADYFNINNISDKFFALLERSVHYLE